MVYELDKDQCVTFSSLRISIVKQTETLERLEHRFDQATAEIVFLLQIVEAQAAELIQLRAARTGGDDERSRQVDWTG